MRATGNVPKSPCKACRFQDIDTRVREIREEAGASREGLPVGNPAYFEVRMPEVRSFHDGTRDYSGRVRRKGSANRQIPASGKERRHEEAASGIRGMFGGFVGIVPVCGGCVRAG